MRKKAFNKHFWMMIISFIMVIVAVMTFVTFIEEATAKDKFFSKNKIDNKTYKANFNKLNNRYDN